ncbi:MAG TPA: hypothetical protein VHP83_14890 [Aggregatilineaceae bacterium]|nr:hypothetical protein [Aggregatilineaceae bacterium]
MRYRLFSLMIFVTVVMLIVANTATTTSVSADQIDEALLEGRARLDAYRIYFAEGNDAAGRFDRSDTGVSRLAGLLQRLGADLQTLEWRRPFPTDADLVILVGPIRDLGSEQVVRLWMYLNSGGRVLVFANPPFEGVRALKSNAGLFEITWNDMGIRAQDGVIAREGEMRTVTLYEDATETPEGATPAPTATPQVFEAPLLITDFVTTSVNSSHPITQNLTNELAFFGARPLEIDATLQLFEVIPLVYSAPDYYGETDYDAYVSMGQVSYSEDEDLVRGQMLLAAISMNATSGARLLMVGDREFVTNGGGFQTSPPNSPSFLYPGNVEFILNAITWILDAEPQALTLPTPGPTYTPIPASTETPEGS